MSLRMTHLWAVLALALCCAFAAAAIADVDEEAARTLEETLRATPHLVYSEDWSGGTGGWSNSQSYDQGRSPVRIRLGLPQAQWGMYFWGSCGWAIRGRTVPEVPIKVSILAYILRANRNALSVNVRTSGGGAVYKYGFGPGSIGANKQPPSWTYRDTDLGYRTETPYELYSIWIPNTGRFALGLKNLVTGEERMSQYLWACRSQAAPGCIDFDQEGGQGPAVLGRVSVYMYY